MQEKCSPEAHDCKIPSGEHASGPPPQWLSTFGVLVLGLIMMSEKVHFLTTVIPSTFNRLATSLLAAMLSVRTCSGMGERLPTHLLSSRTEKYECTHILTT